jgi:hypothetical protein
MRKQYEDLKGKRLDGKGEKKTVMVFEPGLNRKKCRTTSGGLRKPKRTEAEKVTRSVVLAENRISKIMENRKKNDSSQRVLRASAKSIHEKAWP